MGGIRGQPALLPEVAGKVGPGAVDVGRRLEHHAAHRRVIAGQPGEQVERPDDVRLVCRTGVLLEGIGGDLGVDDGVDPDRPDQLADQRMADVELQKVGLAEVLVRFLGVDPDDLLDRRLLAQPLDEERSPPARHAGHQHATLSRGHRDRVYSDRIVDFPPPRLAGRAGWGRALTPGTAPSPGPEAVTALTAGIGGC